MKKATIVVLGCDLASNGSRLGKETVARCESAFFRWACLSQGGFVTKIMLTPGLSPRRKSCLMQTETMGKMMARWFRKWGVPESEIAFNFPLSTWGTRAELREAFTRIVTDAAADESSCDSPGLVYVISSKYHLRRCKLVSERIVGLLDAEKLYLKYSGPEFVSGLTNIEIPKLIAEFVIGLMRKGWYLESLG